MSKSWTGVWEFGIWMSRLERLTGFVVGESCAGAMCFSPCNKSKDK